MALYLKLVVSTLAILNFIAAVTSQDEIEHGLATHCHNKCMNRKHSHSLKSFHLLIMFVAH